MTCPRSQCYSVVELRLEPYPNPQSAGLHSRCSEPRRLGAGFQRELLWDTLLQPEVLPWAAAC